MYLAFFVALVLLSPYLDAFIYPSFLARSLRSNSERDYVRVTSDRPPCRFVRGRTRARPNIANRFHYAPCIKPLGSTGDADRIGAAEATAVMKKAAGYLESLEASPKGAQLVKHLTDTMVALQSRGLGTALAPLLNDSSLVFEVSSSSASASNDLSQPTDATKTNNELTAPDAAHNITADELFTLGANHSMSWREMLERRWSAYEGEAVRPAAQFPVAMESMVGDIEQRMDLFAEPSTYTGGADIDGMIADEANALGSSVGTNESAALHAALAVGMKKFPVKAETLDADRAAVLHVVQELVACNDAMMQDQILRANRDIMLSDNFIFIMHQLNATNRIPAQRHALAQLVNASIEVVTELAYAVEKESARHLRTIHDVCEVASKHRFEPIVFMERMNEIKPRFDTEMYGFLQYAIREEEIRLKRVGITAPSAWLQVLRIVETGVYEEFAARYDRILEPIILSLRFHPQEFRSELFGRFVNITTPMDLRFMRELALNMVDGTLNVPTQQDFISRTSMQGFAGEDTLETRLRGLRADVNTYLSVDFIDNKEREYKSLAAAQNTDIVVQPRNPMSIPGNFLLDDDVSLLEDGDINRGDDTSSSSGIIQEDIANSRIDSNDNEPEWDEDESDDDSAEDALKSEFLRSL